MLFEIIHEIGAAKSNSDAKRKIQQGGAYINRNRVLNEYEILYSGNYEIKVGKHFEIELNVK
jgi:tyrosyl-tRNA synthetase